VLPENNKVFFTYTDGIKDNLMVVKSSKIALGVEKYIILIDFKNFCKCHKVHHPEQQ
jgi:hypothetical protein